MSWRIGIDVGGTFTDFVLVDNSSGRLVHYKEPSTPADPARAVETGVAALLAGAGIAPADVALIVHGTTISLNSILQRRGARLALVVSRGNRDLMEIARVRMAHAYDFFTMPERPLVPRDRVVACAARLDADGTPWLAPDDAELERIAARLGELQPDAVAVVILNAHADPAFEDRIAQALQRRLPAVPVTASTTIWSELREYERATIAVMNAYVAPTMRRYYERLEAGFRKQGFTAPLSMTTSNGGTIDVETARDRPIDTILSGPASGVVAAIAAARRAGIAGIVTFDMGGTSADIAIAEADEPEITTRTMIGELPLILPVVNVGAIGAGGGSIVRVDGEGMLKVGPTSAGADPGPACYGRGGTQATITDCYLACGLLDPHSFLGGRVTLSADLAEKALLGIAQAMGLPDGPDRAARAAEAAIRVASSMMATETRKTLARRGSDPRAFTLVPYGGAGPTHAAMLAEEAGLNAILVASSPGTFCALGATLANLRRDFVKSCRIDFAPTVDATARAALAERLDALIAQARSWMDSLGPRASGWRLDVSADMRYPGEAFELTVTARDFRGDPAIAEALVAGFHRDHLKTYDFQEPHTRVELTRLVLTAVGLLPQIAAAALNNAGGAAETTRRVFLNGAWHTARRFERKGLSAGQTIAGPAIVDQPDTTVVVPPGWRARTLADGALLLNRTAGAPSP